MVRSQVSLSLKNNPERPLRHDRVGLGDTPMTKSMGYA